MADKKSKEKAEEKIILERVYNVPLRREWLKSPRYKRAKKAGIALKEFMQRHMKSEDIRVGNYANMKIWERGIKNPPHHIQVKAVKFEDGHVFVELDAKPKEKVPSVLLKARAKAEKKPKREKKEEESKTLEEAEIKGLESKEKEIKKEEAAKAQEIQKEEIKELKKEKPRLKPAKVPAPEHNEIQHQQAPAGH